MTVSYNHDVATVTTIGFFWKLFKRFRGSVIKLILFDYIVFLAAYFTLSLFYRNIFSAEGRIVFEKFCTFCRRNVSSSSVTFILGFYVQIVYRRWWDQLRSIPWPDNVAIFLHANIRGKDDRARMFRRTIVRYVNLSAILCFVGICSRVKKRFPTRQHLIDAGILTEKEKRILEANESTEARETQGITLLPLCWANDVADQAISEGKLAAAAPHQSIVKAITEFRNGLQTLYCYDRVSFPLLYTQVATIFVYGYFFFTLFGKQWLDPTTASSEYKADFYFPLLTSFEFFLYMGWLRSGEVMLNPFGDDDDDFEMNSMIDRHLQVSFQLADGSRTGEEIEVDKDPYWELVVPPELPHTIASEEIEEFTPFEGSTAVVEVPSQFQKKSFVRHSKRSSKLSGLSSIQSGFSGASSRRTGGGVGRRLQRLLSTVSRSHVPETTQKVSERSDETAQKKADLETGDADIIPELEEEQNGAGTCREASKPTASQELAGTRTGTGGIDNPGFRESSSL